MKKAALMAAVAARPSGAIIMMAAPTVEELKDLPDPDGVIRTRCEFCSTVYEFPLASFG